jgi:hypothetical protein
MRTFETGAIRDGDDSKFDYEGFVSPLVLERFAAYMHKHRQTPAGLRDSDNWQKGIPPVAYMKSAFRHFFDWWKEHRGLPTKDGIEEAICALIFNAQGYLHELLKAKSVSKELRLAPAGTHPASGLPLYRPTLVPAAVPNEHCLTCGEHFDADPQKDHSRCRA